MKQTIKFIANNPHSLTASGPEDSKVLETSVQTVQTVQLANDADPRALNLDGVQRVDLHFPKFTDGRAYSQAFLLRRRLGFKGEIRATGDVLIDQLVLMQRSGFDSAELRADQNEAFVEGQFERFGAFYQGDAVTALPLFQRAAG